MFRILDRTSGNLVGVGVEGDLTASDLAALRDEIAPLVEEHGQVRLLVDLSRLEGFGKSGPWDEQGLSAKQPLERAALIVPREHTERALDLFGLDAGQTRTFAPGETEQAWHWLTNDPPD